MKMKNKVIRLIGVVTISAFMLSGCGQQKQASQVQTQNPSQGSYTLTDVSQHAAPSDCWTAIDGSVYNITSFISSHPGGPAIVQACGKDASGLFHSVEKHSGTRAQQELTLLKIGTIK